MSLRTTDSPQYYDSMISWLTQIEYFSKDCSSEKKESLEQVFKNCPFSLERASQTHPIVQNLIFKVKNAVEKKEWDPELSLNAQKVRESYVLQQQHVCKRKFSFDGVS